MFQDQKMDQNSKSRFPNLANVAISILESKIEPIIGKETLKELKSPLQQKELNSKLEESLKRAETRFIQNYPDKDVTDAITELTIADLPSIKSAIWMFYENPTNNETIKELEKQIEIILPKNYRKNEIAAAARHYIQFIWEEMVAIPDIRDKLNTLATIRTERNTARSLEVLQSIDGKLSNQTPIIKHQLRNRYQIEASSNTPALILFLIDAGFYMKRNVGDKKAINIVFDAIRAALIQMARLSTKGDTIAPRYYIGLYTYGLTIKDILGGIVPIQELTRRSLALFDILDEPGDAYEAFLYIERILKEN